MGQALGAHRCHATQRIVMALRIFALATDAFGSGGGIAQYNRDLFQALSKPAQVDEVVILPRFGQASTKDIPPKLRQFPACPGKFAFTVQALRVALQHGPFDVIFCGHLFMVPLAVVLSRLTGAPVWLQIHGIEAWQCPSALQLWAAEQAQLVTAVSRHTRRLFLTWANCEPERIKVLPNTVDERFKPGPAPDALIDRLGLRGKQVLLTVSRLSASERYKGHDHVIRAVSDLRQSHPDIVYVVAGDGDDRQRLAQLALELGVLEQVLFVGYVPDSNLPDLYRAADVFVMPSTGEGFGIVFLQALASGIAVIGGDSDGSCDPLRDGIDGHQVSVKNSQALANAIVDVFHYRTEDTRNGTPFTRDRFEVMASSIVGNLSVQKV